VTIDELLLPRNYIVRNEDLAKERGSTATKHCIVSKDGVEYFAFKLCPRACPQDRPEHYQHIQEIQTSISRMARMVVIEDVVLIEKARGQKLWEMDTAPNYAEIVERHLIEFARSTHDNQLIHGDLRPWNVFFDADHGVQVIDWLCLSSFVDDLVGDLPRRRDLVEGQDAHYVKFHSGLVAQHNFTEIDLANARLIGMLLRGKIGRLGEAWPRADPRPWYPHWCPRF
jgi:hypothetical protein